MITRSRIFLLACAASGWFTGCSSSHHQTSGEPSAATTEPAHHEKYDMESPPHVGMTKEQVLAQYGEPVRRTYSEEGEQWLYRLNDHGATLRDLNPFDTSDRTILRHGVLLFNSRGHVKRFRWDAGPGHGND